jgi:predicted TIM-barrel fold metal-dependent hydrolase
MRRRKIVDAHHHLWDLGRGYAYPWLQDQPLGIGVCGDIGPIAKDYLIDDYLAETASYELVKSVFVEAVALDPVAEAQWVQSVSDSRGYPNGSVAFAALNDADAEHVLARHAEQANVRGIRQILNWHANPSLTFIDRNDLMADSVWLAGFALLKKYGFSFDLQIYPNQLRDAVRLARQFPETLIVLNHTGMPVDRDDSGIETWRAGMAELAGCDNVVAKISGLGMVDWSWNTETIRIFVLHTIECFGARRVMFASNFPVDRLYSSFAMLYGAFEEIVSGFSAEEQDHMFHLNAIRHYRL